MEPNLNESHATENKASEQLAKEQIVDTQPTTHYPQPTPPPKPQQQINEFIKDEEFEKATGKWKFLKWTETPHVYTLKGFAYKNQKSGEWELDRTQPQGFDKPPMCAMQVIDVDGQVCCDPDGKPHVKSINITAAVHLDQMKPLINEAIADGSMIIIAKVRRWQQDGDWLYETVNMKHQATLGGTQ